MNYLIVKKNYKRKPFQCLFCEKNPKCDKIIHTSLCIVEICLWFFIYYFANIMISKRFDVQNCKRD